MKSFNIYNNDFFKSSIKPFVDSMLACSIVWDTDFNLLYCNNRTLSFFSVENTEELYLNWNILSPKFQPNGVLSSDSFEIHFNVALKMNYDNFTWNFINKNGINLFSTFFLNVVSNNNDTFVVATFEELEIKQRRLYDKKYDDSQERAQLMYENLPISCVFFDYNGNIIDCNKETLNLFKIGTVNEFIEKFYLLSPEYQPILKKLSKDAIFELLEKTINGEKVVFQWIHNDLDGKLIPVEVTMVRIKRDNKYYVVAYAKDLREIKKSQQREFQALERMKVIVDSAPYSINIFDENYRLIDCNLASVKLVNALSKEDFINNYDSFLPPTQSDGQDSHIAVTKLLAKAFNTDSKVVSAFDYIDKNGNRIPTETTLIRSKFGDKYICLSYKLDLSAVYANSALRRDADERLTVMLNATPLCSSTWDKNHNIIDCNDESVKLFDLNEKDEYINFYYDLCPIYQPDGRHSKEKMVEMVRQAFELGNIKFEWMHQSLNQEPIPTEKTLIRVFYEDTFVVICYTRDLRDFSETAKMLEQLEKIAFTDALTEIYNRRYFMENAENYFNNCNEEAGLIIFDLDFFKKVNDKYGHLTGDEVLKHVANTVINEIDENKIFARYGGEEFLILFPGFNKEETILFSEKIRKAVCSTPYYNAEFNEYIKITISIGITIKKVNEEKSITQIIDDADTALYKAKKSGRNRIEFFDEV